MNAYRARPLNFPWPPLVYVGAAFGGLALQLVYPLLIAGSTYRLVGILFFVAGISLDLWALFTLYRRGTTMLPNRCASHLVTCGPFQFSRNPTYLGYTLAVIGVGLFYKNLWIVSAALAAAAFTHLIVIRREEMHLHARFGYEFERYRRRVRAWL
ncbi:methyltransferase family protein [Rhizobium alvei]|uniref:Isoprenylcysteine carboxylmethyltransferase family protein n=1 Tax=Rhizobium alvei TaxID=1132659 RepID=A0ABT8YQ56_9HYPH|nr:isoprenylcysteine carboxylmethyltransferase family protein [Rhizobium alvei]MDO6965851.1 isoprenylcysteine carboxylmethyltransferase family protein [Rhizobium alvei]